MTKFKDSRKKIPRWLQIIIYTILGILGMAAIGALLGFVIMWLWNWLMPELFGLKAITYWQGVGLFILAKILFGAIGGSKDDSKKPKDKKECRVDPHKDGERKEEPDGVEYYDEWWEKEGKMAFDDFVNNRYTSEKASETESEREKKG